MSKSREHVVTNGRAVFYACMWEDFKNAALDGGWALGLHGSLNSDMDIMAMPWVENARPVDDMIKALEDCLTKPDERIFETKVSCDKPNNRTVYTIHIYGDFYLDINVIQLLNSTPNAQVSDTTKGDSSKEAGKQKEEIEKL
jgi:hypothetical protein